jgi:hypothetical protein
MSKVRNPAPARSSSFARSSAFRRLSPAGTVPRPPEGGTTNRLGRASELFGNQLTALLAELHARLAA